VFCWIIAVEKQTMYPMTRLKPAILLATAFLFFSFMATCQDLEKVPFDDADRTNGYYLAIPPSSQTIAGVIVLLCPFRGPESILPETRLHNIAAVRGLLTVYASTGMHILPDQLVIARVSKLLAHIVTKYKVDSSLFALGGFDMAGTIALRYTELAQEHPAAFIVHPKLVFAIASYVDLAGLYRTCERQIKRNYYPPTVSDAKFMLGAMIKEQGTIAEHPEHYAGMSPYNGNESVGGSEVSTGNEQFLKNVAVRLYYDTDIEFQLKTRRNGYYDTNLPDGSEMIDRLLLSGNNKAEFIASKQPGMRSNGSRNTSAYSIVDETDCIHWIIRELHIFDPGNPAAFSAPYQFDTPEGWRAERSYSPPPFAPKFTLKGIEEIRFMPGWGIAGKEDYFSLAYLFWLDGGQKIDAGVLQENLKIYFDGLVITGGGPVSHNIPSDKLLPTRVRIQKMKAEPDDLETYSGAIDMLDYMTMKPMTLNCRAHVKNCDVQKHTALFIEASPKPFSDPLWQGLEKMKKNFKCGQ
jgi:hypothetical protein